MKWILFLMVGATVAVAQDQQPAPAPAPAPGPAPAPAAESGPAPKRAFDELGFPVTFNDERITRNDVARSMGAGSGVPAPGALKAARDQLLMNKLTERIGQLWGIRIGKKAVDAEIHREMELRGGEAKFYQYLGQRGDTLARYEEEKRLQILRYHLNFLLENGVTPPPVRRILPWSLRPSPEEVRIAFAHDRKRIEEQGARARGLVATVAVDRKTKIRIVKEYGAKFKQELEQQALHLAAELVAKLRKGQSFPDVARALGLDPDAMGKQWQKIPKEEANDPILRFFQTAKPETFSDPIVYPGGIVKLAYLIERQEPGDRSLADRQLQAEYRNRIHSLRRDKAEAMMRIDALDRSLLQPDFLRGEFRKTLVADLREAVRGLRGLGIH